MTEILLNLIPIFIVISLLYLLIYYLLKKYVLPKASKWLRILVSFGATILLYFIVSFIFLSALLKTDTMDFDKTLWNQDTSIQYKMVDDLIEEKLLIGKNEQEVKDLLGEPQKIDSINYIWNYEIIGRTWADFYYVDLELTFKNSMVTEVDKREQD